MGQQTVASDLQTTSFTQSSQYMDRPIVGGESDNRSQPSTWLVGTLSPASPFSDNINYTSTPEFLHINHEIASYIYLRFYLTVTITHSCTLTYVLSPTLTLMTLLQSKSRRFGSNQTLRNK